MLKEQTLTKVVDDSAVMEAAKFLKEAKITYDVCVCTVTKYALVMNPHQRGTTTRTVSEDEILEARANWESANRDLALAAMDTKRYEGKLTGATRAAIQARVPALRKLMRTALSKFYSELDKSVMANSEVLAARRLACEILGDTQNEIPDLAWPELLPEKYRSKSDECLLDFRRQHVLKSGWL